MSRKADHRRWVLVSCLVASACPRMVEVQKSQTRVDLALDLLTKGEDVAAEAEIKRALAFNPRNEEAYNVWGKIYVRRAAAKQSLAEYDGCLDGLEGDVLRKERDEHMHVAEDKFRRATLLASDYGDAWQNLGAVAVHFKDWKQAILHERKALAQIGRLPVQSELLARANLGWAYLGEERQGEAATTLMEALQKDPSFCLGTYRLAAVLKERGEWEDAAKRLAGFFPPASGTGQPSCPALLEAFHLAGQVYLRLEDVNAARTAFGRCSEAAPKSCLARQCGAALRELGE